MTDDVHFYDPKKATACATIRSRRSSRPRVIGWISSRDAHGRVNLAPYSFFGAFATFPSIIGFSSEGYKDSIRNIEATGEFVWNLSSRDAWRAHEPDVGAGCA